MLSASLVFNSFFQAINGRVNDILFLNTYNNEIYVQNIKHLNLSEFERKYIFRDINFEVLKINYNIDKLNGKYIEEIIEKLFNYSYYAYLSFLRDNSMIKFKYLNYYIDNILKNIINFSVNKSNYNHKITQLEELKIKYYKEKGSLISRYFKNKDNKLELDNILNEYSSFVFSDKFKEQYNYLLNQRKIR